MKYAEHDFEIGQDVLRQLKDFSEPSDVAAIRTLAFEYAV
jgi:hypothetical protein